MSGRRPENEKAARSVFRNVVVVLGDQLSRDMESFDGFDAERDVVWMAESAIEAEHVWSHKQRIVLFLSAMRHFRAELEIEGIRVAYSQLDDQEKPKSIVELLEVYLSSVEVNGSAIVTEPGEWRLKQAFEELGERSAISFEMREDRSFLCSQEEFRRWAEGRKQLRMEYFYREMRKRAAILMDGKHPAGGKWNFDASNRGSFSKNGPEAVPSPVRFEPDSITREVMKLVEARFPEHPGNLDTFAWPVTVKDAEIALSDFLKKGLPEFGRYQDAMWSGEPFLHHSLLSPSMNLKLLPPRKVVDAVENEFAEGRVPIESAEGFIRQVIGWREYVRGVYWLYMPDYIERNEMEASEALPDFYWTGETSMNCLKQALGQTLEYGYAHHIQRLMVTGLFSLLWGVEPKETHRWYLSIYVDAVEWVELPNTLGMSQYADGGVMASKPYVSTGKYINRMSNYCQDCRYKPDVKTGEQACPFTVLYWEYLAKHEKRLAGNQRMGLQLRNLKRMGAEERSEILAQARKTRQRILEHTNN
jgi:deoxyribodipyrimidine photolyase-related protein